MSPSPFLRRINVRIREVIADEVERLKDPGLGFVTITGVDTAPDLRSARVYYSVLGDEDQQKATRAALRRAAGRLRRELRFEPDGAIAHGQRIEQILRDIREEHRDDDTGDPEGG